MDQVTTLLWGPLIALVPILLWELAIKPARTRRNVALLLMAELELNLEEIAYYEAGREEDPERHLANLLLPRASFAAAQPLLAELPAAELRTTIRFYAITAKIEATHARLLSLLAQRDRAGTDAERRQIDDALGTGLRALGSLLAEAWATGDEARTSLDDIARSSWMDVPPTIVSGEEIRSAARAKRVGQLAPR